MANDNQRIGIQIGQMDIIPGEIKQRHLVPGNIQTGQIYYGLYGGNFTVLDIGQPGQVLMVVNGQPSWQNFPPTGTSRPTSGRFIGDQYFNTSTGVFSIWTGAAWLSTTLS